MRDLLKLSKTLWVLYVEDNEEARVATMGLLSNLFDHITVAVDGRDGLDKFCSATFDLIISDINMPGMNGIELTEAIRKIDQEIPILILSAYNESGYFIETIKHGVDGYLLKPIELKQLFEMIRKVVEKIQLKKELEDYRKNLEDKVKEQSEKLYRLYFYDKLTGLPNRTALEKSIDEAAPYAIMLIDIRDFSVINEIYGDEVGDKILVEIAKKLERINRSRYKTFRVGGDVFALLDMKDDDSNFTPQNVEAIVTALEEGVIRADAEVEMAIEIHINTTVSIAINGHCNRLLKNAELALHYAKRRGRQIIFYSDELDLSNRYKKEIEAVMRVKKALEEDRVVPFYQEIVKEQKEKTFECLGRIVEEDRIISPFFFLDAIKKTHYYEKFTRTIIQKAFEHFRGKGCYFSINLSYEDIANKATMRFIESMIERDPETARYLILEILESESVENFEVVKDFIQRMHRHGVKIAIDDFGSGYSNFSHLLELNPDFIKIDGSLVKDIHENEKSFIIVKTINNFAKELGIKTVVEFVHNEAVYKKAKALGVSGFQGFYFCEPAPQVQWDR